jgi:hypothetical protein
MDGASRHLHRMQLVRLTASTPKGVRIIPHIRRYDNALAALAHAQLLAPQTPHVALCSAETAYAAGDVSLALKTFLRAAELCGSEPGTPLGGVETRAWFGVKLVRVVSFSLSMACRFLLVTWSERIPRVHMVMSGWKTSWSSAASIPTTSFLPGWAAGRSRFPRPTSGYLLDLVARSRDLQCGRWRCVMKCSLLSFTAWLSLERIDPLSLE